MYSVDQSHSLIFKTHEVPQSCRPNQDSERAQTQLTGRGAKANLRGSKQARHSINESTNAYKAEQNKAHSSVRLTKKPKQRKSESGTRVTPALLDHYQKAYLHIEKTFATEASPTRDEGMSSSESSDSIQ